jgi:hypothetical protein
VRLALLCSALLFLFLGTAMMSTGYRIAYGALVSVACTVPGAEPAAGNDGGAAAAAAEGGVETSRRECIICSDDDMKIVSMAPCGHYFCGECLQVRQSSSAPIQITFEHVIC